MTREPLSHRRSHVAFTFNHWNTNFTAGVGREVIRVEGRLEPVGPIKEVFINCKTGTHFETLMRDQAIILSIALQFGASIEALRGAITRNSSGEPMGPVGALLDMLKEADDGLG